ncbi:unnamed protein product [Absidia cylindrospora]
MLYNSNIVLSDKQRQIIQTYFYSLVKTSDTSDTPLLDKKDKDVVVKYIDNAIQLKYKQVAQLVSRFQPGLQIVIPIQQETANLLVSSVQRLCAKIEKSKITLLQKKLALSKEITAYVKVILELMDVLWVIIQEFKYTFEKDKNQALDAYLDSMVDSTLLYIRKLHLSILVATYDDNLVTSLKSLRSMLKERLDLAIKETSEASERLQNYHHLGPTFEKLRKTYANVVNHIIATEDDIRRMEKR